LGPIPNPQSQSIVKIHYLKKIFTIYYFKTSIILTILSFSSAYSHQPQKVTSLCDRNPFLILNIYRFVFSSSFPRILYKNMAFNLLTFFSRRKRKIGFGFPHHFRRMFSSTSQLAPFFLKLKQKVVLVS
jgi:hypothetical protein